MAVYSHDNLLMSQVFLSSLKGIISDWFNSILKHSLQDFEEVR